MALSVLPLAAAFFWGFSQVAERSVTTSADDRLRRRPHRCEPAFKDDVQNAERADASGVPRRSGPPLPAATVTQSRFWVAKAPSLRVEDMAGHATIGPRAAEAPAAETDGWVVGPRDDRGLSTLNDALVHRASARARG